jgi:hypothetical protein
MKSPSSLLSLVLVALLAAWPVLAETSPETLQLHADATDGSAVAPGAHSLKGFSIQVTDESGVGVSDVAVVLRLPDSGPTGVFGDGSHAAVGYTDAAGRTQISGIQWSVEAGSVPITITATKGAAHAGILLEELLSEQIRAAVPASVPEAHQTSVAEVTAPTPAPMPTPVPPQPGPVATPAHLLPPTGSPASPSVSIVNAPTHEKFSSEGGSSHKKWYIIAAIAVAAGVGAGVALMGKSSPSSASTSAVSIGAPSVSVGHP